MWFFLLSIVSWTDRRSCRVSVGLHGLLEGTHFLDFVHLSPPRGVHCSSLLPF